METVEYRSASHEDMPRKFLDIRFSDHPTIAEKGQLRPFPAFRRGWVKGRVPCRYLGQRPKPSESYASFLSTVFKVHLSLIFLFSFFHNSVDTTHFILYKTAHFFSTFYEFHNRSMQLQRLYLNLESQMDTHITPVIDSKKGRRPS